MPPNLGRSGVINILPIGKFPCNWKMCEAYRGGLVNGMAAGKQIPTMRDSRRRIAALSGWVESIEFQSALRPWGFELL
jgi:hypothetical protein